MLDLVEEPFDQVSRHMLAYALAPEASTPQRILSVQAVQFPELAKLANEEGWLRAVRGVASLLRQSAARGQIEVDDPELAADMFLNLVLGHRRRLVLCGRPADPKTEERHREVAVDFFLIGVRTE